MLLIPIFIIYIYIKVGTKLHIYMYILIPFYTQLLMCGLFMSVGFLLPHTFTLVFSLVHIIMNMHESSAPLLHIIMNMHESSVPSLAPLS
jgi:hypothetical protein